MESWQSGRMRQIRNLLCQQWHRGFKSLTLRQVMSNTNTKQKKFFMFLWTVCLALLFIEKTPKNKSVFFTTSSDKLWLFSEVEIDNTTTATYSSEGVQYDYWKIIKDGTVAANRIKKRNGSASAWWLRSPFVIMTSNFRYVYSSGSVSADTASYSYGVSFGFCI